MSLLSGNSCPSPSFESISKQGTITLADSPTSGFPTGTVACVSSVGDGFRLQTVAGAPDGKTIVAAKDDPLRQWVRLSTSNIANASQDQWVLDPKNGDDDNTGTPSSPLATAGELRRRLWLANLKVSPTVTVLNDLSDDDPISLDLMTTQPSSGNLQVFVNGTPSITATITVASSQLKNASLNQANEISVPGFDFAPYVGKVVRLQGTTTDAAVITKAISLGNARLGERTLGSIPVVNGNGYPASSVLEILTLTKAPGISINGSFRGAVRANLLRFDPMTGSRFVWLKADLPNTSGFVLTRSEVHGVAAFLDGAGQVEATSFTNNAVQAGGNFAFLSGCAFINATPGSLGLSVSNTSPLQTAIRSSVFQNYWATFNEGSFLYGKADLGMFDLPAGKVGISLRAYAKFHTESLYYGSGNHATSTGMTLAVGATASYTGGIGKPTMDSGNGVQFGASASVPFSTLPVAFDTNLGTAFYAAP